MSVTAALLLFHAGLILAAPSATDRAGMYSGMHARQGNSTPPLFIPATNNNSDGIDGFYNVNPPPVFGLVPGLWDDYLIQPYVAAQEGCFYSYDEPYYYPPIESVGLNQVWQGHIGDCVLLSTFNALTTSGYQAVFASRFHLAEGSPPSKYFDVWLYDYMEGVFDVVHIDDRVPYDSTGRCGNLGLQVYTSSKPDQPGPAMPLLEKAVAKFLDARPHLRLPPVKDAPGYGGIGPFAYEVAMSILTGWWDVEKGDRTANKAYDSEFFVGLTRCIDLAFPCVIGTVGEDRLDTLGGTWDNDTKTATLESCTVQSLGGFIKVTPLYSTRNTPFWLVGNHAYAVRKDSGFAPSPLYISITNPWNFNPQPSEDYYSYGDATVVVPRELLWQVMGSYGTGRTDT